MMELWDIRDENGIITGRTVERGKSMKTGEYHLVVFAWIRNSKGEYLISKRTPNKSAPNMWETTGGSAIVGEESMQAILREVKEELGITLNKENGKKIMRLLHPNAKSPYISDVWLFEHDIEISELTYQQEEVCDAQWVEKERIQELIREKTFVEHEFVSKCWDCI